MSVFVKVSGAWKSQNYTYVRVSGAWKTALNTWARVSGVWKRAYTYSYSYSGWSACSKNCGGGTQTRTATCRRSDGVTVPDSFWCNPTAGDEIGTFASMPTSGTFTSDTKLTDAEKAELFRVKDVQLHMSEC